jgi:hypothetical protein
LKIRATAHQAKHLAADLEESPSCGHQICSHESFQALASEKIVIQMMKLHNAYCGRKITENRTATAGYLLVGVARWEGRRRRNVAMREVFQTN